LIDLSIRLADLFSFSRFSGSNALLKINVKFFHFVSNAHHNNVKSFDNIPLIASILTDLTWRTYFRQPFASRMRNRYINYVMLHLVLTPAEWALL
jgi:hypothetical protein